MLKKIKFRSLLANSWVLLFLAVLVAGGLTFLLYKYLNDREKKLKADMDAHRVRAGVTVVVPAQDVPVGTPLSSGDFVAREIAGDLVYDDMIRADNFEQYRSSHLVKPVRRGLPLRAGDIDALRGRDFSDVLRPGTRALTVEIDTVNATALLLRPGNHVDVYWVGKVFHEDHTSDEKKVAQLVMPNVLVLATGEDMRPRDAGEAAQQDQANANSSAMSRQAGMGYTTVTLEIPVDDVARVALAQKIGGLRLILRNSEDKGADGPSLAQESDVFIDPARGRVTGGTGPAPQTVEVISGGGANSTNVIVSQGPASAPAQEPQAPAPADAGQSASASPQRQPSLYEQANAIARQLQKAAAPSTSKQN
ncbi:Flp pilus assembly protein CpaB [Paraburkholderia xenovorans LB400]|jgi:pilus assembly protein CpaB|uniref:Flp pilus assembly CpaB n=1 Tax=Paraburkholderia xenovorans (strain LB400) TaxID=266265 RepID=Q13S63_PARXL|nr:Flp pilus assembly protein CpaB [Paraburkholderia xenovorans]ABE33076.1 Putative Flp pilus assembly CpaB [Paraburkholderia xenovorans LB400]AIP36255.1 Flp pilus assembly protein CpaB [Paraburkholderia xenovorans LB400]